MSGRSSRQKGQRGERQIFALLNSLLGREVFRRNLSQTRAGGADHEADDLPVALEVKFQEKLNIGTWLKQAREQAAGRIPALAYRQSREEWTVLVELTPELFALLLDSLHPECVAYTRWHARLMREGE